MSKYRSIAGFLLLCTLAFGAFAAADASASGTTGFRCKPSGGGGGAGFKDAHCTEPTASGAAFIHEAIGTKETSGVAQNLNTDGTHRRITLSTSSAGVAIEISCNKAVAKGVAKNVEPAPGEMQVHGTGIVSTYSECEVLKPAKGECVIPGGKIITEPMTATTFGKGSEEMGGILKPEGATPFVKIVFEKCKNAALNQTYPVTGSVTGSANGSTGEITPASSEKTLTFGGEPAKLTTSTTGKIEGAGGVEEDGAALTTVP
jgi:hypothetical protein